MRPTSRTGALQFATGKRWRMTSRTRRKTWGRNSGSGAPLWSRTQRVGRLAHRVVDRVVDGVRRGAGDLDALVDRVRHLLLLSDGAIVPDRASGARRGAAPDVRALRADLLRHDAGAHEQAEDLAAEAVGEDRLDRPCDHHRGEQPPRDAAPAHGQPPYTA